MSVDPDSNEPEPRGDLTPAAQVPEPAPAAPPARTSAADISCVRASVYAVGAALVAGFLAWGIGEKTYDYYRPSLKTPTSRDFTVLNREERIAARKNTAMAFGTFGALLGMFSGAPAVRCADRSWVARVRLWLDFCWVESGQRW